MILPHDLTALPQTSTKFLETDVYIIGHSEYDASNIDARNIIYKAYTMPSWKNTYLETTYNLNPYLDLSSTIPALRGICRDTYYDYFNIYESYLTSASNPSYVIGPGKLVIHNKLFEIMEPSNINLNPSSGDYDGSYVENSGYNIQLICMKSIPDASIWEQLDCYPVILSPAQYIEGGFSYEDYVILKVVTYDLDGSNYNDCSFYNRYDCIITDFSYCDWSCVFQRELIFQDSSNIVAELFPDYTAVDSTLSINLVLDSYDGSWLDSSATVPWIDPLQVFPNAENEGWDDSGLYPEEFAPDIPVSSYYIPDDILRAAILAEARRVTGKTPLETVYLSDLLKITSLYLERYDGETSIERVQGITYCKNLVVLDLYDHNAIIDASLLAEGWWDI